LANGNNRWIRFFAPDILFWLASLVRPIGGQSRAGDGFFSKGEQRWWKSEIWPSFVVLLRKSKDCQQRWQISTKWGILLRIPRGDQTVRGCFLSGSPIQGDFHRQLGVFEHNFGLWQELNDSLVRLSAIGVIVGLEATITPGNCSA